MNRRELLLRTGAAALTLGLSRFPLGWAAESRKRHILVFTRSQGFEHSVVKRKTPNDLSMVETIMTDLGKKHGFEVTCTKDGRVFQPENIAKFDAFFFETTGDLTKDGGDGQPPMPVEGKKAFLDAIAKGKGFAGSHCASDTFHSAGERNQNQDAGKQDAYIAMLGGEFISHGSQQKARMHVTDAKFPGAKELKDFELMEEWYALKNFAPDLHVILMQETEGMRDWQYQRPPFPATWARKYHQGRVFYTSMGHREDVWQNSTFQALLLGGLSWAVGNVQTDVAPNLDQVAAKAGELSVQPPPPKKK